LTLLKYGIILTHKNQTIILYHVGSFLPIISAGFISV